MRLTVASSAPEALEQPLESLSDKLENWLALTVEQLPNLFVALMIVGLSVVLSRLLARWLCRGLERTHLSSQLNTLATAVVRVVILVLGLVLALNAMNLDRAVATALAGVGVVGLALGFAFQDIAANFISGVFMAVKQPFSIGQVIETNGFTGTVERVGLRATELRRFTGELVLIPNRQIFSEALTNVSAAEFRRIDLGVGVSYSDDLDRVEALALEAVQSVEACTPEKAAMVLYRDFGSSSIDLEVRFWVPYSEEPLSYLRGRSDAIKALKRCFDAEGITIPFPIRTLDFDVAEERVAEAKERLTA